MDINLTEFGVDLAIVASIFTLIEAVKWVLKKNKVKLAGWIWTFVVLAASSGFAVFASVFRGLPLDELVGNILKYLAAAWVYDLKSSVKKAREENSDVEQGP